MSAMPPADSAPLFEAVIVPHRSLSARARRTLIMVIGAACLVSSTVFAIVGAWPVGGFAGAEWLLAIYLIRLNARAARGSEVLLLSPDALRISRTTPKCARSERVLSPAWLRVSLHERPGRVPALLLRAHGVEEEVGASLGEAEKRDLADALSHALDRWRHPVFDNPQLRE
jgi:uncharacterized membrane protein